MGGGGRRKGIIYSRYFKKKKVSFFKKKKVSFFFLKKKRKIRIAGEIEISKLESKLLIESLQGRLSFSLLLESPSSSSTASNHFQHWKTSSPFWVSRKSFCHLYAWLTIYSSEVSCSAHALMPDWKGGWVL